MHADTPMNMYTFKHLTSFKQIPSHTQMPTMTLKLNKNEINVLERAKHSTTSLTDWLTATVIGL